MSRLSCSAMRKLILPFLLFTFLHTLQAQKKAVFIIVDGIPAEVIETISKPYLDSISREGGYARAYVGGTKDGYSQSPTISAVGYNHVLTGVWSHKHNVWDNNIAAPNYAYPTIFKLLKQQRPQATTAIFSTWTDNRTKLVGEGLPATGNLKLDYVFDGYELDTARFPAKDPLRISKIDDFVADAAAATLKDKGPDLSWVYLEYTDDMGHRYGDSKEFHDAIRKADDQVGRIWRAVKYREQKFQEQWMIVITTDHGRKAPDGKHHGGQTDRERITWMVTNVKDRNARFTQGLAAVDVAPSIARFLGLSVEENTALEWDGIPFIGPLSIEELQAQLKGKEIQLSWKGSGDEMLDILLATTNQFKEGKPDTYVKVGSIRASAGGFVIQSVPRSGFYKIVVKGKNNAQNAWIKR